MLTDHQVCSMAPQKNFIRNVHKINLCSEIALLKLPPHLPGANGLMKVMMISKKYISINCIWINFQYHDLVLALRFWTSLNNTTCDTNYGLYWVHDGVIKWKRLPGYWLFVQGIHRSPMNSPHKGQWRGALMFSLICAWINGWVSNREAGDLRTHRAHYDVNVMGNVCQNQWMYWLVCSTVSSALHTI